MFSGIDSYDIKFITMKTNTNNKNSKKNENLLRLKSSKGASL